MPRSWMDLSVEKGMSKIGRKLYIKCKYMNKVNHNLVSFIVAAYNEETYISECIDSCLQQTWPFIEVIITDDGSTDNTTKIVQEKYAGDDRVKILRFEKNTNKIRAFNNSFSHSEGSYIAIIGADDINKPDRIAEQVKYSHDYDLSMTDVDVINFDGSAILSSNWMGRFFNGNKILSFAEHVIKPFGIGSIFMTRELANKIFPLPEDIIAEDFYIPLLACYHGKVIFINNSLYKYRFHKKNSSLISADLSKDLKKQCFKDTRDLYYYRRASEFLHAKEQALFYCVIEFQIFMYEYLINTIINNKSSNYNLFHLELNKISKDEIERIDDMVPNGYLNLFNISIALLYKYNLYKECKLLMDFSSKYYSQRYYTMKVSMITKIPLKYFTNNLLYKFLQFIRKELMKFF
jgi:glycosyltransferase involved in cell wall biosynthesis